MPKKKPALTPFEKKMEILKALYPYDNPEDGLNAYTIENSLANKVDLSQELTELCELGYIVEISGRHFRKNAKFYNITPQGKEMVLLYKKLDAHPRGHDLIEWALRRKGIADKFIPTEKAEDPK